MSTVIHTQERHVIARLPPISFLQSVHINNYLATQIHINKFFGGLPGLYMEEQTVMIVPPAVHSLFKDLEWTCSNSTIAGRWRTPPTTELIEGLTKGLTDIRRHEEVLDKDIASRSHYLQIRQSSNSPPLLGSHNQVLCPAFNLYTAMHNIQNVADIMRTIYDYHHAHPAFGTKARQAITSKNMNRILCKIMSNIAPEAQPSFK